MLKACREGRCACNGCIARQRIAQTCRMHYQEAEQKKHGEIPAECVEHKRDYERSGADYQSICASICIEICTQIWPGGRCDGGGQTPSTNCSSPATRPDLGDFGGFDPMGKSSAGIGVNPEQNPRCVLHRMLHGFAGSNCNPLESFGIL